MHHTTGSGPAPTPNHYVDPAIKRTTIEGVDPASLSDPWEPEPVVMHSSISDPAESRDWGVTPGDAVCGFRFTADNYVGPRSIVSGDSRFIIEECQPCLDWLAMMRLWVDNNLDTIGGGR